MKKTIVIIFWIFIMPFGSIQAQELKKIDNNAFIRGEKLKFKVYYHSLLTGNVTAGEATLEISEKNKMIGERSTYHVVGKGKSKGAFNLFYKVNDRFESYIDEQALVPWIFIRRTREGTYSKDDDVTFNHYRNIAKSRTATCTIPDNVQDILSILFYARTVDFSNAKVGDVHDLNFFLDDSVYKSQIIFLGTEEIKTKLGRFNAIKLKPSVATGNVFDEAYPMVLWVTNDKNRLPLIAESEVIIGSVRIELIDYAGLANKLTSRIK
ncbi:DUF3108 domain-containing protein [candidate division KSB1 bacterium]